MEKKLLMPIVALSMASLGMTSCDDYTMHNIDEDDKYMQTYADLLVEQCNNFREVQVNLTSNVPGMYCSVFTEYPYDENNTLISSPILAGLTPINTEITVPDGTDNLYIVTRNGVMKREVKNLSENLSGATSRSMEMSSISEELLNAIDQAFPERKYNLKNQDVYFNTDLKVVRPTEFALTYVSDGLSDCEGLLYMYTYPSDTNTPTIDQCTFYGIDQATGDVMKLEGLPEFPERVSESNKYFKHPLSVSNYIFSNVEDKKAGHRKAGLGTIDAGVKIGFCFLGVYDVRINNLNTLVSKYSFTTPSLNDASHSLNKIARNDASFKYKEPVNQGCFKKVEVGGRIYYVLGMENSFPDGISYDADYNDMMCVLSFDPQEGIEANLEGPESLDLETYKYARGYYMFEDNYPDQGDYDFNDVVVQYEIKTYVNRPNFSDDCNEVRVALLAHGCGFNNEFGFYVGDKDDITTGKFVPVFKNIQGYVNVDDEVDPSQFKYCEVLHFPGTVKGTNGYGAMIRPYLKSPKALIFDNSFTRNGIEYPYVLDVPLETTTYNYTLNFNYTVAKEAGKGFRWCKENKRLDAAYKNTPKVERWYMMGYKDESLLIKREANADESLGLIE